MTVTTPGAAFIAGATGYTGRALVHELRSRSIDTIAHIRPDSPTLRDRRTEFERAGATVDTTPWQEDALADAGVGPSAHGRYLQVRWRFEQDLRASGVRWVIARPALITGPDREESRRLERILGSFMDGVLRVAGCGGRRTDAGSVFVSFCC